MDGCSSTRMQADLSGFDLESLPPYRSGAEGEEVTHNDGQDADLMLLAIDAIKRLPEADYARFWPIRLKNDDGSPAWYPQQHSCHSNAATVADWYKADGLKRVFGYLVFSPEMTGEVHWIVAAHSLVEARNGELFEVTDPKTDEVPFIRHRGSDDQERRFREAVRILVSSGQLNC
jgi:hypothetical protein